jgi:hypothetical protein
MIFRNKNNDYNEDYERSLMFGNLFKEQPSILDEPIAKVLTEMNKVGPDSDEYKALVRHLEVLTRLKAESRPQRVSPDALAVVAGNLLGILIIVAYEQKHVMVSKGLGFVMKVREPHIQPHT